MGVWSKEVKMRNNGSSVPVSFHSRRVSFHFGSISIWKKSYSHRNVFVAPGQQSGDIDWSSGFSWLIILFLVGSTESRMYSTIRCGESEDCCFIEFLHYEPLST